VSDAVTVPGVGATNAWYVRDRFDERTSRWVVRGFRGPRYRDGMVIDADDVELDGAEPLWMVAPDRAGHLVASVSQQALPQPLPVWFCAVTDVTDRPDEAELVAFASDVVAPGTIVDRFTFATLGVDNSSQVAAVKWRPSTGVVAEVFVHREQRRQQLATLLLYSASAFHQSNGWPGALRSDGRRTDLGERFVTGLAHPQRIAPWTERAGPMDAVDAAVGPTPSVADDPASAPGPAVRPLPAGRLRRLRRSG
jgi:hypothetical protein